MKVRGKIRAQALGQGIRWSHHPGTLIKVTETQKESHLPTIPFVRGFYSTYLSDLVYLPQPRHVKYQTVVQNHNMAVPAPRPIPVHLPFNNSLYTSDASNCLSESWTTAGTLFSPVSFSDHEASRYKSLYDVSLQTLDTNRSTMYHCQIPDTLRSPKYQSYVTCNSSCFEPTSRLNQKGTRQDLLSFGDSTANAPRMSMASPWKTALFCW